MNKFNQAISEAGAALMLLTLFIVSPECIEAQQGNEKHLYGIFENLVHGIDGDDSVEILITESESKGPAYYHPKQIIIHRGLEHLFDSTIRDDAIAYVIAHELAHHERNHLCSHFVKKVSATTDWADERLTKEQNIANSKRIETEADSYAGLYGHISGYRPLDVAEQTLDIIYDTYNLPDSIPGYPTLDERKVISARSRKELNQVAKAYDAAWIALATEEFAAANYLLSTIIIDAEYESPEMHGLLALAQFLEVVRSINDPKLLLWSWPIQMQRDTNSRTRGISRDAKESFLILLVSALNHAQKANKLNAGKDALTLEEFGREETGLEASILWLKKWVLLDGQDGRDNKLMEFVESKKKVNDTGFWSKEIANNLNALTCWAAGKDKKALKLLSSDHSAVNRFNVAAINETRTGGEYMKLVECEEVRKLEQEAIPRFSFGSAGAEERIVVGGKRVLTVRYLRDGVVDLEVKQGLSELNFVMLEPEALYDFCWGVEPSLNLEGLRSLFGNQRKTVIKLSLGSIMCLPDEHLAFQFNAKGELSFVALSLD